MIEQFFNEQLQLLSVASTEFAESFKFHSVSNLHKILTTLSDFQEIRCGKNIG